MPTTLARTADALATTLVAHRRIGCPEPGLVSGPHPTAVRLSALCPLWRHRLDRGRREFRLHTVMKGGSTLTAFAACVYPVRAELVEAASTG